MNTESVSFRMSRVYKGEALMVIIYQYMSVYLDTRKSNNINGLFAQRNAPDHGVAV